MVSVIGDAPQPAGNDRGDLSTGDRLLTDSLAEGLVRFDAAGQIEAGVAERWIVTDGGMSYIFRLRDAIWANGKPVEAAEVVAILKRQIARGSRNRLAPYLSAIDSIVEMTPQVIEIELTRPRPDLLKLFAQPELAIARPAPALGAGPLRVKYRGARSVLLTPIVDPSLDEDAPRLVPEDDVRLIWERAARAITRFVTRNSDLVIGGTVSDWPILQVAQPAAVNIKIDPANGLFGLRILRRDGFLADPANRAAVAEAIDRNRLTSAVSTEWVGRETLLPDQLDSAAPLAVSDWVALTPDARTAAARAQTQAWRASNGAAPDISIALPASPGGTLLWARIAADLFAVGIRPIRVAADDRDADLTLVDEVAPYDSARWYLRTACAPCSDEAEAAIDAARLAPTLAERGVAIAAADAAVAKDVGFIPLARPFRWSLVAGRLAQWQANPRAWHPLNRLRNDPN